MNFKSRKFPIELLSFITITILFCTASSNAANFNESDLPKFTYSAGLALFDKNAPFKLLDRNNSYFIKPEKIMKKLVK